MKPKFKVGGIVFLKDKLLLDDLGFNENTRFRITEIWNNDYTIVPLDRPDDYWTQVISAEIELDPLYNSKVMLAIRGPR